MGPQVWAFQLVILWGCGLAEWDQQIIYWQVSEWFYDHQSYDKWQCGTSIYQVKVFPGDLLIECLPWMITRCPDCLTLILFFTTHTKHGFIGSKLLLAGKWVIFLEGYDFGGEVGCLVVTRSNKLSALINSWVVKKMEFHSTCLKNYWWIAVPKQWHAPT